ncbi:TPA: hypothetical protein ENS27_02070 [bacterium]|mgnify:CR=1 FL=1|nr:hypothetical protein [bacterium]
MKKSVITFCFFVFLVFIGNLSFAGVSVHHDGDVHEINMSYQNLKLELPNLTTIEGCANLTLLCYGCKEKEVNTPSGKHNHNFKFDKAIGVIVFPDILIPILNIPLVIGMEIDSGMMIEHGTGGHSVESVDVMSTGKIVTLSIGSDQIILEKTLIKIKDGELQFIKSKNK